MAKKKGGPSSKNVNKAKDRIISDKTFGLKNKKKSKKVQRFVKTVKQQVSHKMQKKYGKGGSQGMYTFESKMEKKRREQEAKMMADITGFVPKKKKEPEKKPLEDVPPDFIQGVLELFYQKYARDKVNRIPAIMEKYKGQYHKLEAGLKKQYKDKAPDLQELYDKWKDEKKEEIDILEQAASWQGLTDQQICIQIEKKRRKLDISKCTPVTPETFKIWREKKLAEDRRIDALRQAEEDAKLKSQGKKKKVTGRALYQLDASIFKDDEEAMDEIVVAEDAPDIEEGNDQSQSKEGTNASTEKQTAAVVQDESLFLDDDDDLPDD
uniref:ZC3H15/TMA46 family C-terminal domain-containing protein n=1 Tax=Amorphochlora amoebiformis TaxID=1561963 RepID=A0A7S0H3W3_9EUKA